MTASIIPLPTSAKEPIVNAARRGRWAQSGKVVAPSVFAERRRHTATVMKLKTGKLNIPSADITFFIGPAKLLASEVLEKDGARWPSWPLNPHMKWEKGGVDYMLGDAGPNEPSDHWKLWRTVMRAKCEHCGGWPER